MSQPMRRVLWRAPIRGGVMRRIRPAQNGGDVLQTLLRAAQELGIQKETVLRSEDQRAKQFADNEARREREHALLMQKLSGVTEKGIVNVNKVIKDGRAKIENLKEAAKGDTGEAAVVNKDELVQTVLAHFKEGAPSLDEIVQAVLDVMPPPEDGADADETRVTQNVLQNLKDGGLKIDHIPELAKALEQMRRDIKTKGGYVHGGGVTALYAGSGIQVTRRADGNYTIVATGAASTGYQAPTSGAVDGSNQTFTWASAPHVIVVDQGRPMQKVSSDGTVNWTGTTTTVLAIAPTFDVYAAA